MRRTSLVENGCGIVAVKHASFLVENGCGILDLRPHLLVDAELVQVLSEHKRSGAGPGARTCMALPTTA